MFYGFYKKKHAQNIRKMNISTKKHAQTLNEFAFWKKNKSKTHVKLIFSIKRNENVSIFNCICYKTHPTHSRNQLFKRQCVQTLNEITHFKKNKIKNGCKYAFPEWNREIMARHSRNEENNGEAFPEWNTKILARRFRNETMK